MTPENLGNPSEQPAEKPRAYPEGYEVTKLPAITQAELADMRHDIDKKWPQGLGYSALSQAKSQTPRSGDTTISEGGKRRPHAGAD